MSGFFFSRCGVIPGISFGEPEQDDSKVMSDGLKNLFDLPGWARKDKNGP